MASILRVNTLTDASSNNSTAMSVVNQGTAKAWLQYNQVTPAVTGSYNISSVTDNGTGDYTTTFANDFSSVNYVMGGWCGYIGSRVNVFGDDGSFTVYAAGTFRMKTTYISSTNGEGTDNDSNFVNMMFTGDLA